ncbi:MAG: efflux transporter outer membrane subunit [Alphaproteobacteria bacterium]|nr:efflux transporter outer membrane subunit [Alphaproteobacteria bacterium]
MVGPDFENPMAPNTDSYTETKLPEKTIETKIHGGETQHFVVGKDIPGQWWELFHSKSLNELIKKAICHNPNLQAAQAALNKAEETLNVSIASLFPFVGAQYTRERQRFNGSSISGQTTPPITFNLYNAQVNVTYTLDVFGGIRRQIESSAALAENQRFIMEATYLTLAANVVTSAITEASLRAQIKSTEDLIDSQKKVLDITKKKFALGGSSRLDVLTQESQLAQNQATLPILQLQLDKTRNALAAYTGEVPSQANLPTFNLDDLTLPKELPVSVPSSFVQQRPDIRAAEALLHSASAQIGVATANLLPQVTLNGSNLGWSAIKLDSLFEKNSLFWSMVSNVVQPIFQGGALIAKREAAIDEFEQACAQYKQAVLTGFQNVADTLSALKLDADFLKVQTEAEIAAKKALDITQAQYTIGAVDYVALLLAQRQYHTARIDQIRAQASRYTDTAALFQALGGGWWNRDTPCKPLETEEVSPP